MSALATRERPAAAMERPQRDAGRRRFDHGATLEDRILEIWEDLVVEGRAACPVCGGSMAAASGCKSCGSELT